MAVAAGMVVVVMAGVNVIVVVMHAVVEVSDSCWRFFLVWISLQTFQLFGTDLDDTNQP